MVDPWLRRLSDRRAQPKRPPPRSRPCAGSPAARPGASARSSAAPAPATGLTRNGTTDYSVSAVLSGVFTYRAGRAANLLYPGALLLGNEPRLLSVRARAQRRRPLHLLQCARGRVRRDRFDRGVARRQSALSADAAGLEPARAAFRCDRERAGLRFAAQGGRAADRPVRDGRRRLERRRPRAARAARLGNAAHRRGSLRRSRKVPTRRSISRVWRR